MLQLPLELPCDPLVSATDPPLLRAAEKASPAAPHAHASIPCSQRGSLGLLASLGPECSTTGYATARHRAAVRFRCGSASCAQRIELQLDNIRFHRNPQLQHVCGSEQQDALNSTGDAGLRTSSGGGSERGMLELGVPDICSKTSAAAESSGLALCGPRPPGAGMPEWNCCRRVPDPSCCKNRASTTAGIPPCPTTSTLASAETKLG